jgi:hypothetical protein
MSATGITYVYPQEVLPRFFADAPLSQSACDNIILSICKGAYPDASTNEPVLEPGGGNFQGAFSYSVKVTIGSKIYVAQFRKPDLQLDREIVKAAQEIYGNFVPKMTFYENFPMQVTFSPYGGVTYALQEHKYGIEERRVAVVDYAKFVARGLSHSKAPEEEVIGKIRARVLDIASWQWGGQSSLALKIKRVKDKLGINSSTGRWLIFRYFERLASCPYT